MEAPAARPVKDLVYVGVAAPKAVNAMVKSTAAVPTFWTTIWLLAVPVAELPMRETSGTYQIELGTSIPV